MSSAIVPTKNRLNDLKSLFEKAKPSIAAVLPKHLTPEKILKITLSAASRTPKLLECTSDSILLAVMQCAQLGLEPNTPLGLAYLLPYNNRKKVGNQWVSVTEAQFIPGYRGLIKLAHQSGDIASIRSRVVRAGDEFTVELGSDERIVHKPNLTAEGDDAAMIAVYAVAEFKGGATQFEVMSRAQVDAIRAKSRAADNGPWVDHFEEMARKTVIRRLCKSLPLSTELASALEAQARAEGGEAPEYGEIREALPFTAEAAERVSATDAMKATLAAKTGGKPDPDDDTDPPNGTDGRGKGSAEEGDDAHGGEVDARPAQGAQASVRLVREWTEEDLVAKAVAWEAYIGLRADPWEVRGAFRKRAAAFNAEGVLHDREAATLRRLAELKESDPMGFLYCTTKREREASQRKDKAA